MSQTGSTYQTIVVGTDGSDRAAVAVREAMSLAKLSGAKLHVVHVIPYAVKAGFADSVGGQDVVRGQREEVGRIGERLAADAEREGVAVEVHNPHGDPAAALIDVAVATDADLLVVGNRGMTGKTRFVLGSIPNKVSHHCPCSLLIVNTDSG